MKSLGDTIVESGGRDGCEGAAGNPALICVRGFQLFSSEA